MCKLVLKTGRTILDIFNTTQEKGAFGWPGMRIRKSLIISIEAGMRYFYLKRNMGFQRIQ